MKAHAEVQKNGAAGDADILVSISGNTSPATFSGGSGWKYVLMPMRI